jgi:microcystin degradation protein MlrC
MTITSTGRPVVGVGYLIHESNSFNSEPTTLAEFRYREGPDLKTTLELWSIGHTEAAGFVEGAAAAGYDIVPAIHAVATPKGAVTKEAFEALSTRLIEGLRVIPHMSGILLALHGAMYCEEFPQADEEIARRVRAAFGREIPFVLTHDFHGNISPEIVELTDVLITYQQCPHLDMRQRGVHAARVMGRILAGEVHPVQALVKPPMLWNLAFQNTYEEPLKPITDASIELEHQPGILAASVAGGYQYNDVPYIGCSVVVAADGDRDLAQREAQRLADMMWERHELTRLHLPDAELAVCDAMQSDRFPVSLFDVGDNVGGGSPGDETTLLHEFLRQQARGWAIALYDPEAVAAAKAAGIDGAFDMEVGGKSASTASKPVRVKGKIRSLHRGDFIETAVRHGGQRYWSMGHTALIEEKHSTAEELNLVMVTSERVVPMSIHQWVSCGIYPERQRILVAKGTVAPRAGYEPVSAKVVLVDTPGTTSVNPKRFQFNRARPGIWELS